MGIVLMLLAQPTFAAGPGIRVTPPFVGNAFTSVHSTIVGCHSHTKILQIPSFNLSTGRVAFRGEADARNCSSKFGSAVIVARIGLSGGAFVAANTGARSLWFIWNLSWAGNLSIVNRSFCNYCTASAKITEVGQLNDTTNGSRVQNLSQWVGLFNWSGPPHSGSQFAPYSLHGQAVLFQINARLVKGHSYSFWTYLIADLESRITGISGAIGYAHATMTLAGTRLAVFIR